MEVLLQIPDAIAEALAARGDVSRQALEAIAVEGYRQGSITQLHVGQLLGLSRIETEAFLSRHLDLYDYDPDALDHQVSALEQLSRPPRG